jgi:hypothetical protein
MEKILKRKVMVNKARATELHAMYEQSPPDAVAAKEVVSGTSEGSVQGKIPMLLLGFEDSQV